MALEVVFCSVVLLRQRHAIGAGGAHLRQLPVGALLAGGSRRAAALQGRSEAVDAFIYNV